MSKIWKLEDLNSMITQEVQESLELDYKRSDALKKTDGAKKEISKDVSAFANSAGGTIIYGIEEEGHLPKKIDAGLDPNEMSKEWLEQVIN
jgi:predicted HTH transcriptional regulator